MRAAVVLEMDTAGWSDVSNEIISRPGAAEYLGKLHLEKCVLRVFNGGKDEG